MQFISENPSIRRRTNRPSFDNSGNGPLVVPGVGDSSLTYEFDSGDRFRHGANDHVEFTRLTVRELSMIRIINAITEKPDWEKKVFDDALVAKWRAEADPICAIPEVEGHAPVGMTEKTWDWIVKELRDKAKELEGTGWVRGLDAPSRVCKSDKVVDAELQKEVKDAMQALFDADKEKDWHPGSDEKVLNLVHPSMYPLIYEKTAVLAQGGAIGLDDFMTAYDKASPLATPKIEASRQYLLYDKGIKDKRWSTKYQWLPCEVEFTGVESTGGTGAESTDVRITSYINNLHPKHKSAYNAIEKLIAKAIPAWNQVLIRGYHGRTPPRIVTFGAQRTGEMPEWCDDDLSWYRNVDEENEEKKKKYLEDLKKVKEYLCLPDSHQPDSPYDEIPTDEDLIEDWADEDLHGAVKWKFRRIHGVKHPEPGISFNYEDWKAGRSCQPIIPPSGHASTHSKTYEIKLQEEFRQKGLQVIVKIAGTELDNDKTEWDGGSWHVEGLLNEHIIATAIYYYDVDNIDSSTISFRFEADMDSGEFQYEQDEHAELEETFGARSLRDNGEGLQNLGSVGAKEGRMIVFPNTLQHCVGKFGRQDPSRPAHRRMVVLWLVDPEYRIVSTRNVPSMRRDWWIEKVLAGSGETIPADIKKESDVIPWVLGSRLPAELTQMVKGEAGKWLMGKEEAEEERLKLMQERTWVHDKLKQTVQSYNFCEH